MRLITFVLILTLGACGTSQTSNSLHSVQNETRSEYRFACLDQLIDGRNLPMAYANDVCTRMSWRAYPPKY